MSLTETLARVVRRGGAERDADAEGVYECEGCGATFSLDRQTCPDCGGYAIDRADWGGAVTD